MTLTEKRLERIERGLLVAIGFTVGALLYILGEHAAEIIRHASHWINVHADVNAMVAGILNGAK